MQRLQNAAARAVQAVLGGSSLPVALAAGKQDCSLTGQDRAAVQAYTYGTLRHLGYLRFVLGELAPRRPKKQEVVSLMLVALYQLEYGKAASHAVVDSAVSNVGVVGGAALKSFANAVLRTYLRRRGELLQAAEANDEALYSYPQWWIDKLRRQQGKAAEAILRVGNLHPPMTLRVNRRKLPPQEYLRRLEQQGIDATLVELEGMAQAGVQLRKPVPVSSLPGFADGLVSVQDAGAQCSAPQLDLQPGQSVIDACAAPGGKTGHILELADVHVLALDRDPERLERVGENLRRLGLAAQMCCADAADLPTWWNGVSVDRVLLDAPCSASGVVRRHPDIKWLRMEKDVNGFALQQRRLLDALWKVTARGGKLLYVTCSIFREENEEQVGQFLARQEDARLAAHHAGNEGHLLLPSETHDGFFHALFEKN